jgi:uncharacterized beta-barrel protein YwiB (DUF1934 family)
MKKVIPCVSIENNDEMVEKKIKGIQNKDSITYDDDGIKTKIKILNKVIKITRKSKEYSIELNFEEKNKTICKYLINKDNINIELDLYTSIIEKKENSVKIEYELYNKKEKIGKYRYEINFKED